MYKYDVHFTMNVGCDGLADKIAESIRNILREKGMSDGAIASVNVTQRPNPSILCRGCAPPEDVGKRFLASLKRH